MTEQLLESVRAKYGAVAESTLSNDHAGVQAVAEAFGYTAEELTSIPADANMGLSCGNHPPHSTGVRFIRFAYLIGEAQLRGKSVVHRVL